jgi:cell division protease FtsH
MLSTEERHTLSEEYLHGQLITLLAGRAAEKLLLGTASSGADDDIKRATAMARSMVSRWGMDEDIGPVDLRQSEDHPFLGQSIAQPREYADETAARVDRAVMTILKNAETKATKILTDHKSGLEHLIKKLEVAETLDFEGIRECLSLNKNVLPLDAKTSKNKMPPSTK